MAPIAKAMNDALSVQMVREHESASIYHNMAAAFALAGLQGFRKYFMKQADEEREHAERIANFIMDRQGVADLRTIGEQNPPLTYKQPATAFEAAYEHEKKVTAWIEAIYQLAVDTNDYLTQGFLDWYTNEQIQEEVQAYTWFMKIRLAGDDKAALLALDEKASGA